MADKALVCCDDERLAQALRLAGYEVDVAPTATQALPRLRHERWTIVAMNDLPDRDTIGYVNSLPGRRRREIFVLRFAESYTTSDRFQAWNESADLVVQVDDARRLGAIVGEALREKEDFYGWFRRLQDAAGARLGAHA
jgi:DNA-binding response OmpR family regulator